MSDSTLVISSFGLGTNLTDKAFFELPPIRLDVTDSLFVPEYAVLFLYDEFLINGASLERLRSSSLSPRLAPVREMVQALEDVGRLKTLDFQSEWVLAAPTIGRDVEKTLARMAELAVTLHPADTSWRDFVVSASTEMTHARHFAFEKKLVDDLQLDVCPKTGKTLNEILGAWSRATSKEDRAFAVERMRQFLWHVRAHAAVAERHRATTHDWANLQGHYNALKKTELASEAGVQAKASELFSVLWPDWRPASAKVLSKALADKRVEDLRHRIRLAHLHNETFDQSFVIEVTRQVLRTNAAIERSRSVLGWVTEGIAKTAEAVSSTPGLGAVLGSVLGKPLELLISNEVKAREEQSANPWYYVIGEHYHAPGQKPR